MNQENRSELLVDKETQTNLVSSCTLIPVHTQDAETQTAELEYLFKECKIQSFTEDYFDSDAKVQFYTGFPGLDTL